MNSKELLLELARMTGEHAKTVLIEMRQPMMPTWVLINEKGATIIATPWSDEHEKEIMAKQVRKRMREDDVTAYSLVTEAWTALAPAGWNPDKDAPIRASAQADRREIVIGFAADGHSVEWRRWAIKRNHLEQVTALEEESMDDAEQINSWMTTLLHRK